MNLKNMKAFNEYAEGEDLIYFKVTETTFILK
jgi:hypothetical protein